MNTKLVLQILIGVAGYLVWAGMAFFDPSLRPDFLHFNIGMAVGTIGLVLRDMQASAQSALPVVTQAAPAPLPPVLQNQAGFAQPLFLLAMAIYTILLMTGCSSLQYAGTADYTVKPFVIDAKTGAVACCEVAVHNGKEMASIEAHILKQGDNITVDLKEVGVQAFGGQAIAAGAVQNAIDAAAKAAAAAALAPIAAAAIPLAGAVVMSGTAGAVAGGAALGVAADKVLAPAVSK